MIILLEGIDASGKTSHAHRLAERLSARLFEFPNYTTATGQLIRAHLQKRWNADWLDEPGTQTPLDPVLDALVFQCLQTVNRLEVAMDIEEAAVQGDVVMARYWHSAYVYGVMDRLDGNWLIQIHESLPQPDLAILLDIDAKTSFERRGEGRDRYEGDPVFLDACAQTYRSLWARESETEYFSSSWEVIDARGSKEEVAAKIDRLVDHHRDLL